MTEVKICGIKDIENLQAAITAGASYIGFVFYPSSPRYVDPRTAGELIKNIPSGIHAVGLVVNATDKEIMEILEKAPLTILQLHGNESPTRISEIKTKFGLPIIKSISVENESDLQNLAPLEDASDIILFDTKVKNEFGGTGQTFDWTLLKNLKISKRWMLSGGLNTQNIQGGLSLLKPDIVDVSSGVESAKGIKDAERIKQFIATVKSIS